MCSTEQRVDAEAVTRTCAYPRLSRPEHSGRWQLTRESSVDHADGLSRQLAAGLELGVELLGPQHLHPSSGHRDVVDVRPGSRDQPVMQQPHRGRSETVQALAEPLLPERTGGPRRRGRRLVRDSRDEAAELWVLRPDALLTSRRAPLELPTCGCPGRSRLTTSVSVGSLSGAP